MRADELPPPNVKGVTVNDCRRICTRLLYGITVGVLLLHSARAGDRAIEVKETDRAFVISNGILSAQILKRSGDLRSLKYKDVQVLTDRSGHAGGYWSHDTVGGKEVQTRVTIDPASNGGERVEVAVKGISGGALMGHGPGAAAEGDFPADIEIRYSLRRGDSAIYTYCIFDHLPEYDAASLTEARFAVKLADFFDWISVDENRNRLYPKIDPV